jgi:hypothetical protein
MKEVGGRHMLTIPKEHNRGSGGGNRVPASEQCLFMEALTPGVREIN